jgi:hypothetical protein
MSIINAVDAEVAYRRERITEHFRPWRRVGTERRTPARDRDKGQPTRAAAASVVTVSR